MNKLTVIGYTSSKKCYINVPEKEAIERYCVEDGITPEEFLQEGVPVLTYDFHDEFEAYDAWV